jgi:uncharacterized protein
MPTLTRPGVYVDTSSFPTYVSATPGTAAACFVGPCPRGPFNSSANTSVPTYVNSWREFTALFGGFETAYPPSLLHLAVYSFFSAGGSGCMVIRAVRLDAQGPTLSEASFNDQATTSVPTLKINAANPGSWGNNLWIDILPGTVMTSLGEVTTFTVVVKYQGSGPTSVVETWPNLSMTPGSTNVGQNNYAPDIINNPYSGSKYINVIDLNAASAAPRTVTDGVTTATSTDFTSATADFTAADQGASITGPGIPVGTVIAEVTSVTDVSLSNPATVTATGVRVVITPPAWLNQPESTQATVNLTGGDDGQPLTFQDQLTALQLLDQYPNQPFVINLPGYTTGSDISNVIGYAEQRGNGFVVVDCPNPSPSPATMVTYANGMSASPQAAVYYPQVQISDPYSAVPGVTRMVPPGGFIVGQYIATDMKRGVQKAPAGLGASLLGAYGLELTLTNADQGNLTQANVNCLISVPGSGVVIWGARTLSPYLVTRYVPVERTLIYLSTQFVAMTMFAVFEPNDWVLWNSITQILSQFLTAFWQSGGLQGTSAAAAFYVTCDDTVNTPGSIQQGVVNVEVGVALQFPAEFVVISVGQWAGGQSVTVTTS